VSMITDGIDRQVIDAGTALKVIANAAVGYNNIDVAAARERGIIVTNTPGVLTDATADLTWALILGITRRIGEGERLIRRGEWHGWTFDFMLGAEVRGKQLGIVGYGGIGRAVAARGRAFGMRIAYTSRTPKNDPDAEPMPLDRLLATSDVVSLHCPLTPGTRHVIGRPQFEQMKRGVLLINTARGGLVDTDALLWALDAGIVGGAGLDVIEEEEAVREERELLSSRFDDQRLRTVIRNHILLKREDVIITPHIAFNSREAVERILETTVANIEAFLSGSPQNRVA